MAETRTDAETTIPKQRVDESDNSSGNGESIRSSGGSDSLSLNLISGNDERNRDVSIPTDDSHISTDRHRYYIREVTVSERNPASSKWEKAHQSILNGDSVDNQGDDVRDPDINQPQISAISHFHRWLGNLSNSHAVNDGPFQITRGTQAGDEDGILSHPPTLVTRHNRMNTASYYVSVGQIPSIVKIVCILVTMACMLYGVGNVIQRLYHLENQMIQSQATFSQIQDTMKHLEHNFDHSTTFALPDHIDQSMHDISKPSLNDFWVVILFSIISIVAVKICERIDKLEHGHDQTVASITTFDTKIKQQAEISDSQNVEKDKIIRGIQSTIKSLEQSLDKLLNKSQEFVNTTDEYQNRHTHNMNAMDTKMMQLEPEQNKQKMIETKFVQIHTLISVQQENIDNLMEMSSKVSDMAKEGTITQNNISQIETKLSLIQDELQSQLDTMAGNLVAHQSEVNTLSEANQVLIMDMAKLNGSMNAMERIKPKCQESVAKIDLLQKDFTCIDNQHTKLTDELSKLSKTIEVLELNISRLTLETQASDLQSAETAKKLTQMGKLIESQSGAINGLESAQNTTRANVQNDVKILFKQKAELEATHGRRIEDIETGCKQMKAAILGLFMSLNTGIEKFVTEYDDRAENGVALDVVPMMGLAWCSDQTDFRKDDTNDYYTKDNLYQTITTSHEISFHRNKYEIRTAIMKCMTGTYRTEMVQTICSDYNMLQAVLHDSQGRYAICKAIESPDMDEELFTCLAQQFEIAISKVSFLPEHIIKSYQETYSPIKWSLLSRFNGVKTFPFHLVYILLVFIENKYLANHPSNITANLKKNIIFKVCTGLKRGHSAHVDKCLAWLYEKSSPELSHCAALLIWCLLQSDSSWVVYMKGKDSLVGLEKLVANPELNADTKQVIIQILGKCDILVSTDTCGSTMPQGMGPPQGQGSANLLSD